MLIPRARLIYLRHYETQLSHGAVTKPLPQSASQLHDSLIKIYQIVSQGYNQVQAQPDCGPGPEIGTG